MTNEQYQKEILPNLPDHMSDEFIDYLRKNNVVVVETPEHIIIENIKYHTIEDPWHTLFSKQPKKIFANKIMKLAQSKYDDWTMIRWRAGERSIKRFHVHFYK